MSRAEALLAQARPRPAPERPRDAVALATGFAPWWAQRLVLRSEAKTRVVVAGRQLGKSMGTAFEVLRTAFAKPGSYSAVLAPTYQIADTAIQRTRELARGLPVRWKEQKKRFLLPNGAVIQVFSADRRETVRGPSITASYWIDEGAYVPKQAYEAGTPALLTGQGRTIVTTTPAGRNWVWEEFRSDDPATARFRFRSSDSPFTDKDEIARQRKKMSLEKAAQEFDAVFLDDVQLAFADPARLFVTSLPDRRGERELRNALGVDLGKEQDFFVATLMNKHGEARILARWRHVKWTETLRELTAMARAFAALVVLDHGAGGGYGGVVKDHLEAEGVPVLAIKTAVVGTKARLVEQCRADVQWERISVLENEHAKQLRHELALFQGIKRVLHGQEVMVYEGPQLAGEFDDCVVSLCLANWGRVHGWDGTTEEEVEDLRDFLPTDDHPTWRLPGSGSYLFGTPPRIL